jgi:hypothetical protein
VFSFAVGSPLFEATQRMGRFSAQDTQTRRLALFDGLNFLRTDLLLRPLGRRLNSLGDRGIRIARARRRPRLGVVIARPGQ